MAMKAAPYDDWVALYDVDLEKIWGEERKELRRASMILCAFEKEFGKIKANLTKEIGDIRMELKRKDYMQKRRTFTKLAQSERFDEDTERPKENVCPNRALLDQIDLTKGGSEEIDASPRDRAKTPEPTNYQVPHLSPTISKSRLANYKKKKLASPSLLSFPVIPHKIERPLDTTVCDNVIDCSIIDNTPEVKRVKKVKKPSLLHKKKSSLKPVQKSTLTQMFCDASKKQEEDKKFDSNMASMAIDEMLDYINATVKPEAGSTSLDETADDLIAQTPIPQKTKSGVSSSFLKNYDKLPEKKLAEPKYACVEVVRGKERKKLRGWSCKECEGFYKGLGLSNEELAVKMDDCSRHRGRCQPREETFSGFWDLTFGPSQKTQETQESLVFNLK